MKKLCNVVMLPTKNESNVHYQRKIDKLVLWHSKVVPTNKDCINQHFYITSDEEIKEGGWVIREYYPPTKGFTRTVEQFIRAKADFGDSLSRKKIIATTDKSLTTLVENKLWGQKGMGTYNTLPQIPQSFIKAYVEAQGNIKEVLVEYEKEYITSSSKRLDTGYKYILKLRPDNTIIIHQAKTYTRDEIIKLLEKYEPDAPNKRAKFIQENL